MKRILCSVALAAGLASAHATAIDTTNAAAIAAFQSGLTVQTFESVGGVTPQAVTSYDSGTPVAEGAKVFNQLPGVQFSVGGMVGTDRPAVYSLGGGIAGDAHSGSNVLGPVGFDGNTNFHDAPFIEIYFPTKVARVGFWLNPSLGNVTLIAADTNFAFSHETETTLETVSGATAGHFVGISHATADIGGFKILSSAGFTIDDFSYGIPSPVPEPASVMMMLAGLLGLAAVRRR
jgi:hypothetical protein